MWMAVTVSESATCVSEMAQLLAERQIQRALLRYCRGVDRLDEANIRSAFHADATVHLSGFDGTIGEFVPWLWRLISGRSMTMHYLTNTLIEFDPHDLTCARVETYSISLQRSRHAPPRGNLISGARYLDRFTQRDGQWSIQQRNTSLEWIRQDSLDGQWPLPAGAISGRRDGSDPVVRQWPSADQ